MTLTETDVVNHLTNKGAATKFELTQQLGCAKFTVQKAVSKLLASGRVEATEIKKKHKSLRGHTVYRIVAAPVANPSSVNVFEHPEIYNRLRKLEIEVRHLNQSITDLDFGYKTLLKRESMHIARLNNTIKHLNDLDLARMRIDDAAKADRARLDGFAARLIALEKPRPAIDPVYVEIEKDITDKLGGQVSPELLRNFIEDAYAERTK
jgi:hypothetical protein